MQFILLFGPWQSLNGEYSLGRIRVVSIQCDLVKFAVTGGNLQQDVYLNKNLVVWRREKSRDSKPLMLIDLSFSNQNSMDILARYCHKMHNPMVKAH